MAMIDRLRPLVPLLVLAALPAALSACATTSAPARLRTAEGVEPAAAADPNADRTSVYGLYLAGEAALDDGATREAAFYLGEASAHAPAAGFIRERAFAAALVAGEVDRAAALAPAPDDDSSAYSLGLLTRAVVLLSEGRGKEAYALLSDAPAGQHTAAILLVKPWAAAAAGDWKAATAPVVADKDQALAAFGGLGQALLLERAGRFRDADAVYRGLTPRGGVFALAYGAFLERRGRRAEADALYSRGLAHDPTDPAFAAAKARVAARAKAPPQPTLLQGASEALIGPAALLLADKQGDSGLAYLRLALKLDPTHDEAWILVGDTLEDAGDAAGARTAYGHVPASSPEYAAAQGRIANSLQDAGDKDGALRLARATAQAAPHDPQALVVLADLLRDDEQYAEAVQVLDRLIDEVGPDDAAAWRLYYMRGASLERSGRWDAGQIDLQHALKLKPDDPEILNYLGFSWADRGEHLDQALGFLQKATALQPDSGAIVDSLGWAYYRLGAYRQAVKELERAVALDPADAEVNDHLGDAYWKVGRRLEAQYQWRRVLTLDPDAHRKALAESKLAEALAARGAAAKRAP